MRLILQSLMGSEDHALDDPHEISAVGHRVVHGGEEFTASVLIDATVLRSIERFADLAPLHNPANLTGIRAAMHALPDVPHVACFDTAFHATIPQRGVSLCAARTRCTRSTVCGVTGFTVLRTATSRPARPNCWASPPPPPIASRCTWATAVRSRPCATASPTDTSMGLTPLEGLVMGTRSGDFDPAILFYLADKGYDLASLNHLCNKESGLLGVSGISNDMRTLTEAAAGGNRQAQLAIDIFCYRVRKYIGAYLAVLGRVDAVSFTGGIGERAAGVRARDLQRPGTARESCWTRRSNQAPWVGEATISPSAQPRATAGRADGRRRRDCGGHL